MDAVTGVFYGTRVVVWDVEAARKLWSMGFYGKPLGIYKPKSPDFDSPLLLDLLEALYLYDKKYLKIVSRVGEPLERDRLVWHCRRSYVNFDDKYLVYKDLRDKGFVVLSGLKFGVDFAVYRKGPGLEHAPYLVDVLNADTELSGDDIIRAGRLATTVRKRFVIAIPNRDSGEVRYLIFRWWRP